MFRRIVTIALPVAAVAFVSTFFPTRTAQAYPAVCDSNYWTCMYSATTIAGLQQCVLDFQACSGGATPPPPPQVRGMAARRH